MGSIFTCHMGEKHPNPPPNAKKHGLLHGLSTIRFVQMAFASTDLVQAVLAESLPLRAEVKA